MAIVLAVLKWKYFLLGRHFIIRTDQQSLKYLMEQREIGPKYQKWVSKLMGYNFTIQYKSGASDTVADALSREFAGKIECKSICVTGGTVWAQYADSVRNDQLIR